MRGIRCLCVLAAAVVLGATPCAAADELTPHRAVYDVSLATADPSSSIAAAMGRLVFDLSGATCEGYVVNSRFVTRMTDSEGQTNVTDLRSATFETLEPAQLDFLTSTSLGAEKSTEVKGTAEARSDGVVVERTKPKAGTLTLKRAVFPAAHTRLILETAKAGERVLEIAVFDAGDEADQVYETTTVIGPGRTGLSGASESERAILEAAGLGDQMSWRVVISYFEEASVGEPTPAYELAFDLLTSGIAYNVRFNYTAFTLAGELTELSLSDIPDC